MGFNNLRQWQSSLSLAGGNTKRMTQSATGIMARYATAQIRRQLPPGGNFPGYASKGVLKANIIAQPVTQQGNAYSAVVGLNPGAPTRVKQYAFAHEYGWSIRAKKAPYLVFQISGQWFRKKSVYIRPKHWFQDGWAAFTAGANSALETYVRSQWPPVR